jgi:hypothetical protein
MAGLDGATSGWIIIEQEQANTFRTERNHLRVLGASLPASYGEVAKVTLPSVAVQEPLSVVLTFLNFRASTCPDHKE